MEARYLGRTGLACPPIIYGTSFLGNLYRELMEAEKLALMQEWFKVADGPVMIDTAGKYGAGLALEVIGQGLEKLGIAPEQISISNKLGWYRVPLETNEPTFEPGAGPICNTMPCKKLATRESWNAGSKAASCWATSTRPDWFRCTTRMNI